jgi:mRNA interferase RelE/StbE
VSYQIEFSPRAKRDFAGLPHSAQISLKSKIEILAAEPRPRGSKKLSGSLNIYRIRAGDYRVIYEIDDNKLIVLILRAGNRREIYR